MLFGLIDFKDCFYFRRSIKNGKFSAGFIEYPYTLVMLRKMG